MHEPVRLPLLLIGATFWAACGPPPPPTEADRQALMQVSRAWAATAAAGNIDSIVAYWAEDAVVLPPDQPAVVGKEAIRRFVQQSASMPGFSITWTPEQAVISSAGDIGYIIERNTVTFADSSGTIRTQHGKAVTIWRKDSSGNWKCVVDTWNDAPAPTESDSSPAG